MDNDKVEKYLVYIFVIALVSGTFCLAFSVGRQRQCHTMNTVYKDGECVPARFYENL
jgi:hypothetical protein